MSISKENFQIAKSNFLQREELKDGSNVLQKITTLVNELGTTFNQLDGGALSEIQVKLSGYKFYLADHIADLMNKSEYLKAWIKEEKAIRWSDVSDTIIAEEGKVKNKEQIENMLLIQLSPEINEQIFYETEWTRYKMKSFSIDDILTSIVQRIASLKREQEQTKN